jgi:tetratricopeptide (TPR) repeat protein
MHPKAKKRIAILALAVVTLGTVGGGAFVYRKLAVRAEFEAIRADGLAAAAAGDHRKAVELLLKYMGRNPNDVEVLSTFAKSREQVPAPNGGHLRNVLGALQRVVLLDGTRTEDRARLSMLLSDFGQLPEALDQADRVLQVNPADKRAIAVRAVVLQRMRRPAEAEKAALAWAETVPEDVRALVLALATARENSATPEKMAELTAKLEGLAKSDLGLFAVRATSAMLRGDLAEAQKWWREGSKLDAASPEDAVFVADQLRGVRLGIESAEYLVRASEQGKLRSGKLLPARRLIELERFDLLSRLLAPVDINDAAVSLELLSMKAVGLAGTGDLPGADAVVKVIAAREGNAAQAWLLVTNGFLGRSTDEPEVIKKTLTDAMQEGESAPVLALVLADAMARLGETEQAIRVFENLAEQSPSWSRPMERRAHYQSVNGQLAAAMSSAIEAARRGPNDPRALTTLARIWTAAVEAGIERNRNELNQFLEQLSAAMPNDPSTAPMRVVTLARAGQPAEARKVIDQVLAAAKAAPGPSWGEMLVRLATASAATGLGGEVALLDAAEGYGGVTPTSSLTRAMISLGSQPPADVVSRFERERKTDGPEAREWALAWATVLEAADDPRALDAWKQLGDTYKDVLAVQRELLASRVARANLPLRTATVERLKTISGERSPAYRIEEAALLLDQPEATSAQFTEVADRLSELVRASPGNVQARILLARLLDRSGSTGAAIEQLRGVPPTAPESGSVMLMMAELLQRRGDFAEASRLVNEAVTRAGVGGGQTRGAAALLAQQGDVQGAIRLLRPGANDAPDPLRVQLYRQANDLPQAEAEARRLVEAAPDVTSVRTLAEILRARGNTAEAVKTLQRLDTMSLPPGVKELALTDFHLRFLDLSSALASARQATEKAPDNAAAWQALLTVQSAAGDVAGALATVEAASARLPSVPVFAAQKQRVELIRSAGNDPVLTAVIIALLQSPNDAALIETLRTPTSGSLADGGPARAVSRVKELAAKYPLSQPVQMLAVRRLIQLNQLNDAAQLAARASLSFPTSGEAPALAAGAYASAQNWSEALTQSREWRNRSGSNGLPADLAISEALIKLGRFDEAVATVEPYVRNFTADLQAFAPAVFRKAEALSLAGRDDRALAALEPVTRGQPGVWIAWLNYAGERLPPEKAAAWAARAEASPEGKSSDLIWQAALTRATALTTTNSPNAAEARDRVAALASEPGRSGEYLASAALVFDQANDLARAEALYRQSLAGGVAGVALKNNLAMILVRKGEGLPEALRLAEEVVAAAGSVAAFVDTLASVQSAAGQLDKAEETLIRAVNLEPTTAEWRIHLAEIQLKAGKTQEALSTIDSLDYIRPEGLSPSLLSRLAALRATPRPPRP